MITPFNLTDGTRPRLTFKRRTVTLHELAIERGIASNDDNGICRKGDNAIRAEAVAIDHLVGNSGESCNLRGDWHRRLVEAAEGIEDSGGPAVRQFIIALVAGPIPWNFLTGRS